MNGNDVFCTNHANWKDQGIILLEDRHAYSVLSQAPAVPGHYIVVPKKHVESPMQLGLDDLNHTWRLVNSSFEELQRVYDKDVARIGSFYQSLRDSPPDFAEGLDRLAQKMLDHPHLRTRPDAYNLGVNVGRSAGQSVDHFHIHVFPRRKAGKNNGIVTLVRNQL